MKKKKKKNWKIGIILLRLVIGSLQLSLSLTRLPPLSLSLSFATSAFATQNFRLVGALWYVESVLQEE